MASKTLTGCLFLSLLIFYKLVSSGKISLVNIFNNPLGLEH
uniref:Uncharacterized protein n=1 Tax=Anguilla anguilla TaxID=7936 RepID=A0A0E9W317_ANGAN